MEVCQILRILTSVVLSLLLLAHSAFSQFDSTDDGADVSTYETTIDDNGGVTQPETPSTTTPKSTPGPNDLNSTDYIIIGVTCAMAVGVICGGSYYAYVTSKASKKEKEEIYSRYLDRDELADIRDGVENSGYSASY